LQNRIAAALLLTLALAPLAGAQQPSAPWSFAVSGDSRNCGDVVMPAIAKGVHDDGAKFYYHLGDFRAIYDFDQDVLAQPAYRNGHRPTIVEYQSLAWNDFIAHQLAPFGSTPVYLAIGNHEIVPPKTREQWLIQFADWLETPTIRAQRLADNPADHRLSSYYHWVEGPVDFITLDNATPDQFSDEQMKWLRGVLKRDASSDAVRSVVVGMHEALPDSMSQSHAMDQSAQGVKSGNAAYDLLLHLRDDSHKNVYVLASHSHYYLDGAFDTDALRAKGKPLPGWIVGTAGAVRYPLPPAAVPGPHAQTHVYGYMLGTVQQDGSIQFAFKKLTQADLTAANPDYTAEAITDCFMNNPPPTK
jgi:hypothetical protein